MLTLLDALLCLSEFLVGLMLGAFSTACIYMTAQLWQKDRSLRLLAVLFTCLFWGITFILYADATRHLVEFEHSLFHRNL